jgi:molybdate transport system ATP-binding protein
VSLLINIQKRFSSFQLDAQFEVPKGITALFGKSGSGKTSIINTIAGLERPDQGEIIVNGQTLFNSKEKIWVPAHQRQIGYIFQEGRLFPHLSVKENLLYASKVTGKPMPHKQFDYIIQLLGIDHLLDRQPARLSGGEKQRVAIGRALLSNPQLILADEPLSALDESRKAELLPYFERLRDELEIPILYVTHSAQEVLRLADFVVAIDDGKVTTPGPAREVLSDSRINKQAHRAMSSQFKASVVAHHQDGLTELAANGVTLFTPTVKAEVGSPLCLEIFGHDMLITRSAIPDSSALNQLAGKIVAVTTPAPNSVFLALETAIGELTAHLSSRAFQQLGLQEGDSCHLSVQAIHQSNRNSCP